MSKVRIASLKDSPSTLERLVMGGGVGRGANTLPPEGAPPVPASAPPRAAEPAGIAEQVEALQTQQRQAADVAWQALVESVRRGDEIPADKALDLLTRAGKSTDDLRTLERQRRQRIQQHQQIKNLPAMLKESEEIERQYQAASATFETAKSAFEQATGPLRDRQAELQELIATAQQARLLLIDSCPHPQLLEEAGAIDRERAALVGRRTVIAPVIRDGQEGQQELKAADNLLDKSVAEARRKAAKEKIDRGVEAERQLADVEKQLAALDKRRDALHEKMLAP